VVPRPRMLVERVQFALWEQSMIPFAANAAATPQRSLQRRLPMLLNGPDKSQKLPPSLGGYAPHLIHGSGSVDPSSLHPERHLDRVPNAMLYNTLSMGKTPKLPLPLGISSPCWRRTEPRPYETCTKCGKDRACGSGDNEICSRTDRQTHTHTQTCS